MKRSVILTVFSLLVLAQLSLAQAPQTISYQGVLKDASGNLVTGDKDILFTLYDASSTNVWSETHSTIGGNPVTVTDGVFSVILGKATPLTGLTTPPVELGITVVGDEEMPPIELTSVLYSMNAQAVKGPDNVFPGSGFVGIGTTAPIAKLHIQSPGYDGIVLTDSSTGAYSATLINYEAVGGSFNLNDAADGLIKAKIRGYEVDGIQAYFIAGNVGIGTASPTAKLEVAGDVKADNVILPATERWYSIPGPEFRQYQGSVSTDSTNLYLYSASIWSNNHVSAGVHLPDGAFINGFEAIVEDNDDTRGDSTSFLIELFELTPGSSPSVIGTMSTSGATPGIQTPDGTVGATVDNANKSYLVTARWKAPGAPTYDYRALKLYLVRLNYTVTSPLP